MLTGGAITMTAAEGKPATHDGKGIRLFLGGDVMTGRGIDQILPRPGDPRLYESYVKNAVDYVELAEAVNGPIPRPVDVMYPWGDALQALDEFAPDVRIVNLETSVTRSNDYWPNKRVLYRMHPANIGCLTAAKLDCCVLANNHVLDWGYPGLEETLATLEIDGLNSAGAGRSLPAAAAPVILPVPGKGRVVIYAWGSPTSGIPRAWAATDQRAGVNLLVDVSIAKMREIAATIEQQRQPRDLVVASIHWGSNWGYEIREDFQDFAHHLVDDAGVDLVYGHSSHHPKAIEVYRNRPVLYGCGDLLNDYEGIRGHEEFRGDLALMYLVDMDPETGKLLQLTMLPVQARRFRLRHALAADVQWLRDRMHRECAKFGHRIESVPGDASRLRLIEA